MFSRQFLTLINKDIQGVAHFNANDFIITSGRDSENGTQKYRLEIVYRFNPDFRLIATMDFEEGPVAFHKQMQVIASPGPTYEVEVDNVQSDKLRAHILSWLRHIQNDLNDAPFKRDLRDQQDQINNIVEQFQELPNEYFTKNEGEVLRVKLDDLEQRLLENLNRFVENKDELKLKTETIKNDMANLKNDIAALKKPGWAGALVVRSIGWLKDPVNRKLLTSSAQVANDLLLEAAKHVSDPKP